MGITSSDFGTTQDGKRVRSFTIYQDNGSFCTLLTYGATLQRLLMPDRNGRFQDIVLGYDNLQGYEQGRDYFGATIGRCCNRIANASLVIGERCYDLAANDGHNHLHGGQRGFDKVVWQGEAFECPEGPAVNFYYHSPDGEEGYPGNLDVQVTYILTADYRLIIRSTAVSDARTVINLTNHSYFNLAGQGSGSILRHQLQIEADAFTPTDDGLIPIGEILPVSGTVLDFQSMRPIGERIDMPDPLLQAGGGYDHNYVIRESARGCCKPCATAYDPLSGRFLEVMTTLPGIQFYSGNMMKTSSGKEGVRYDKRNGFCLETQYFPDAVHHPGFASPIHTAGDAFRHETTFIFGVR